MVETDLETADGAVRLIDFMPIRDKLSSLVRIVTGLHGMVAMRVDLALRFDYESLPPWSEPIEQGFGVKLGPDLVVLHALVAISVHAH